jgi:hypothetical protein
MAAGRLLIISPIRAANTREPAVFVRLDGLLREQAKAALATLAVEWSAPCHQVEGLLGVVSGFRALVMAREYCTTPRTRDLVCRAARPESTNIRTSILHRGTQVAHIASPDKLRSASLGEDVLLFRRLLAHEQLGRLFELDLEVLSERSSIGFNDLLGKQLTVRTQLPDQCTRFFNGFVTRLRYLGVRGRYSVFSVTLRPWLWFLTRTADCRIFQEMSVPDIIKEVFRDLGFSSAFKYALSGTYKTWDYCVQYRVTDFDFVSRLMELEGIYYYFTHEDGSLPWCCRTPTAPTSPFPAMPPPST